MLPIPLFLDSSGEVGVPGRQAVALRLGGRTLRLSNTTSNNDDVSAKFSDGVRGRGVSLIG